MGIKALLPLVLILGMASHLEAQFGSPMPVVYQSLPTGDIWFPMQGFSWTDQGQQWKVSLVHKVDPKTGETTCSEGLVTAPGGEIQSLMLEDPLSSCVGEEMTGSFSSPPQWNEPWSNDGPGYGRAIYLGEVERIGSWRVMRVLWHISGLSGPPPLPFVLVVQHVRTGKWLSCASAVDYPPTPDRGNVMRLELNPEGDLSILWWNRFSRGTSVLRGWRFKGTGDVIVSTDVPRKFALFTHSGAVSTCADTPEAAKHFGFLEAAWAIKFWNDNGGIAQSLVPSSRKLFNQDDMDDAPLLPFPGSVRFWWTEEIYLVPWGKKPRRVKRLEALPLLRSRKWNVVLFRKGNKVLGERLVERSPQTPSLLLPPQQDPQITSLSPPIDIK